MLPPQYVAGLFDGEGMVSLCYAHRRPWKSDPSKKTLGFKLVIGISNSFKLVLDMLKEQFSGDLSGNKRIHPHWRQVWAWKVTARNTQLNFLEYIRGHVIIKKEQVELGLRYISTIGPTGCRLTQDEWDQRICIHNRLRELNRPGYERRIAEIPINVPRSAGKNTRGGAICYHSNLVLPTK